MAVNLGIVPSQKSTRREFRARLVLGNASVDRTDQILDGGYGTLESSQRILRFSAMFRMAVAKEKASARQNASRGLLGSNIGSN
jgi:hypothetical protein